jgi:hypothetical protein
MSPARYHETSAQTRRPAWLGVALVLLLVLAQTLLLQHQAEHAGGTVDIDCPVCLAGNALDHTATASDVALSASAPVMLAVRIIFVAPPSSTPRRANARAPPSPLAA